MASIADVYVTVIPETAKVADGIRRAFREVDKDAREAGNRWGREIKQGIGEIKPEVDPQTTKAKTELEKFRAEQERRKIRQKIEFDEADFKEKLSIMGKEFDGVGAKFGSGLKVNLGLAGIGLLPAAATAITDVAGSIQQLAGAGLALPGMFAGLASSIAVGALGMQGMKDALEAVNKAADGTQKSVDAANKALAGLAPNQAEAVKMISGLKGTFTDLRNIAGQNLFAGFSSGLKGLLAADLPAVTKGIDGISRGLNTNLLQAMKSLGSGSSQGFLSRIFGNTAEAQAIASGAIDPLVHAFGALSAAGSDVLPRLATALGNVVDRFNAFITNADNDGRLSKWINDGLTGFTHLGNILLDLGRTFTGLTSASGGGAGLLSMLEGLTSKMATFVNSTAGQQKLKDFFQQGRDLLGQLKDIALQAGPALGGVFQAGIGAANVWLPVIRQILTTINAIPGGAAAVVGAFALWKTMQGPIALINSLNSIVSLLKIALPAAAAQGAAGAAGALGGLGTAATTAAGPLAALTAKFSSFLSLAKEAAPFLKIAGTIGVGWGGQQPDLAEGSGYSQQEQAQIAAQHPELDTPSKMRQWLQDHPKGVMTGVNGNHPLGVGIPDSARRPNVWGFTPPPGSPAAAAAAPAPRGVGASSSMVITPSATVPDISSYAPPVVTEVPKGSSATPNLPYTGTADPYANTSGYISDQALLANVPSGRYTQSQRGDLTQGLADCSSAVEDLVNLMQGNSTAGASMATGNAAEWLTAHGFVPGSMPGAFNVGYNSSHMQATLPGGTNFNWGSDAAAKSGGIAPNSGAFDPAFTSHYYLPVGAGDPMSTMYGGGPAGATGLTSSDLTLRNAQQRVNDTQHSEEQAQGRLNELRAKGTATNRQMEAAEYALAKAKREHQDAIDGLTVATDKYNKSAKKDKGNGDFSSLGTDLMGGIAQFFGFDGSLFANPADFGIMKFITGAANLKVAGGDGAAMPAMGGGGGGLGGLLGLAQNFMPGMPGGNSANIADMAQFKPPGGAGSPGPGNVQAGPVFDMRGSNLGVDPAGFNQTVTDMTTSQQRWAPLQQNLPR